MKETKFIQQNKKKWAEFEELSKTQHKDSNLYSKLFIQITDDLSYSRTFYSNRSVRVYLNNLAQEIFHKVFSRNKKKQSVIKDFWMEDLPSIMYYHRMDLLIAFLVTISAVAIGVLTYHYDPTFATKILGDDYLAMTAENIAKKDPMAVYKNSEPISMFFRIVMNNLMVDIQTFFSGLFMGIGTILVLIYNGMMLAAFQFYFVKRHLFYESFLAVWLHGTLEISAMVICGAAGIVLGKGLVFPGTYSRMQSFLSSAQRATKIFFSVLPITFTAGIIESFLTRYTQAPDALRLSLIIASLLFILGYYVYLPWVKKRNGTLRLLEAEKVLPENFAPFEFLQIKKLSDIFIDTFRLFRKHAGTFASIIFWTTIVFTVVGFIFNRNYLQDDIYYDQLSLYNIAYYFKASTSNWYAIVIPFLFVYISVKICYLFYNEEVEQKLMPYLSFYEFCKSNWNKIAVNSIVQFVFYGIISFTEYSWYLILFVIPLQFIATYALFFPHTNQQNFLATFFKSLKSGLMNLFVLNLGFVLLSIVVFLLFSKVIYSYVYGIISINFNNDILSSDTLFLILFVISTTCIVSISFIFFCLYQGVFYFSQKEKHTAEGLLEQLERLGSKVKKYAIEK